MSTTTWTQTHTAFPNGNMGKVYGHPSLPVTVLRTRDLEQGVEGWSFQFAGLFATERHDGFRTMAAARAAAVAYATSPVGEAHAAADAFRAA